MDKTNKKLDVSPLISTRNFLAEIIQNARNDCEKAGAIQAFEVSYELAYHQESPIVTSPRSSYHRPKRYFV